MKKNNKGRYYTSGKKYSSETYAHIFKAVFTYKKMTGKLPLPSHLSKMTSVTSKVAKKVILFASGKRKSLHKPSGHGFEGNGAMKPSMSDNLQQKIC